MGGCVFNHHLRGGVRGEEGVLLSNISHSSLFFLPKQMLSLSFYHSLYLSITLSLSPDHAFNQLFRQKTKVCSHP